MRLIFLFLLGNDRHRWIQNERSRLDHALSSSFSCTPTNMLPPPSQRLSRHHRDVHELPPSRQPRPPLIPIRTLFLFILAFAPARSCRRPSRPPRPAALPLPPRHPPTAATTPTPPSTNPNPRIRCRALTPTIDTSHPDESYPTPLAVACPPPNPPSLHV